MSESMSEPIPLDAARRRRHRASRQVAAGGLADALDRYLEALEHTARAVADLGDDSLRLHAYRSALRTVLVEARDAADAADVLVEGRRLAATFPDGSPAPEVPTPRQALYLASLGLTPAEYEARRQAAEAARSAHDAVLAAYDTAHGRRASRPCGELTKGGRPCRAGAMAFVERPVCGSHATPAERATNRTRTDAYWAHRP